MRLTKLPDLNVRTPVVAAATVRATWRPVPEGTSQPGERTVLGVPQSWVGGTDGLEDSAGCPSALGRGGGTVLMAAASSSKAHVLDYGAGGLGV